MRDQIITVRAVFATLGLLCLAGCDQTDPLKRDYVWHPTDVNRTNIAAMAVNPRDLIHGHGTDNRSSILDTLAIGHITSGKPVALPDASSTGGSNASGGAAGAGTAGSTGGGT